MFYMKDPLFIIGCGRTGSKLLLQILNYHDDVGIGLEMHFANPFRKILFIDNHTQIKNFGDLSDDNNAKALINFCFSNIIIGSFWNQARIHLDKINIERLFLESDRTLKELFKIFIEETAIYNKAIIPGSKFPVHIHYVYLLKRWFPNSKIIHLIRDPRAILASEIKKKNKPRFPIGKESKGIYETLLTFYVIIQYKWAVKIHKKYLKDDNYCLIRFEDLVLEPSKTSRIICDFVGIFYDDGMLNVKVVDSSYTETAEKGINVDSITRWKNNLNPMYRNLVELFLIQEMELLEYEL